MQRRINWCWLFRRGATRMGALMQGLVPVSEARRICAPLCDEPNRRSGARNILCEKALTHTGQEALEIWQMVREAGVRFARRADFTRRTVRHRKDGRTMMDYNGLGMNLGNLSRLSRAKTRSISAENPAGEKGKGGMATDGTGASCAQDLGQGWKVSPSVVIEPGQIYTIADIEGPGAIQSMWLSGDVARKGPLARFYILRIYWDGQEAPSVECPVADFFASGWGQFAQVNSIPVAVNPNRGYNCFWEMPFGKRCRITLENRHHEPMTHYYQINYTLTEVPDDVGYFHAQFRRTNPLPYEQPYTIVDGIEGMGHYVGTTLAWGVNNNGWWGEGEIKFYIDGDRAFPTICGTGTEDYFGGAYNWDVGGQYVAYSTPFLGMHQVLRPDGTYRSQQRFSMYRWHIMDPVRFETDLRVTIQALGWRDGGRYLALQDDIASVAYWYQTLPAAPFPELPDRDYLEII